MEPADQPPELHLILNEEDAFPGRLCGRTVGGPEKESGDDLNDEGEHERAPPDVAPLRATWNSLVKESHPQLTVTGAVIQPIFEALHVTAILSFNP